MKNESRNLDSLEWLKTFESLDKNGQEIISAMMAGLLSRQRMDDQQVAG